MRDRTTSGSPFEEQFGFSRAIREGNRIIVAGTGPIEDDGQTTAGGAAEQAARCCTLIVKAIEALGGNARDVVRTRMFLTEIDEQGAVGEVHARFFGEARPAATMVGVATLCRPEWLVEIEAEAVVGNA
ncbi:RidA family protein [Pontixanthobacter aestiaquae]|uniref:RidA family protein n=1 Tax=Pontixanthobacter aestiaquae TaxID=1509367 RepID=A0A844Z529_9SPHN|nr:RidA family protein [Pontixanthobacter aestiaquae]MDN3646406.1 RidA family protein [Pontixanthobacter aestiaquae]MXO82604.1 RidA family protein [Pontixanthobacter aestiaquae]